MITRIKRAIVYAFHGWNSFDYDYAFIFHLLQFKLKRMLPEVGKHAVLDKKTKQSLRIAVKLLEKINTNNYSYFVDEYVKRYGEIGLFKELDNPEEFHKAFAMDEQQRKRDINLLFDIMKKYITYWWD